MKSKVIVLLMALLVTLPLFFGCAPAVKGPEIIIGILLDLTGPACEGGRLMWINWQDMVRYINEEDPITYTYTTEEGIEVTEKVKLKAIIYDNKFDPGRTPLAFRSHLGQGAKVISGSYTHEAELLKPLCEREKVPFLCIGCTTDMIYPPGWIFAYLPRYEDMVEAFLDWLSTSWWDYGKEGRKPRIGTFGWNHAMGLAFANSAEAYCRAHPDDFEWVDKVIAPMGTVSWLREVERLKDADYIIGGVLGPALATFINELRVKNYPGKWAGTSSTVAQWEMIRNAVGTKKLDGSMYFTIDGWWSDDTLPMIVESKEMFYKYQPKESKEPTIAGPKWHVAYNVQFNGNVLFLEIVRQAVKERGTWEITGSDIYEVAQRTKLQLPGHQLLEYTETKRCAATQVIMYEWDKDKDDFVRRSDWITCPRFRLGGS